MGMPLHMEIEGKVQGKIEGDCAMKGREGTILVDALNHQIYIPRSTQTGLAVGKRVHEPLTVVTELGKHSPKLLQALTTGEKLKVKIKWYRINPDKGGAEEHYYTTELDDAIVVSIRPFLPQVLDKAMEHYSHMEEISFTYSKIIQTHEKAGATAEDDWKAPKE